jgi:hypothetical protein
MILIYSSEEIYHSSASAETKSDRVLLPPKSLVPKHFKTYPHINLHSMRSSILLTSALASAVLAVPAGMHSPILETCDFMELTQALSSQTRSTSHL